MFGSWAELNSRGTKSTIHLLTHIHFLILILLTSLHIIIPSPSLVSHIDVICSFIHPKSPRGQEGHGSEVAVAVAVGGAIFRGVRDECGLT
jgi:hypothetical protein